MPVPSSGDDRTIEAHVRPKVPRHTSSGALEFLKIVSGGVAGLALGYLVICWVSPTHDFLNLFAKTNATLERTSTPTPAVNASVPLESIKPPNNQRDSQPKAEAPTESTAIVPKTEPPADFSKARAKSDAETRRLLESDSSSPPASKNNLVDALRVVEELADLNGTNPLEAKFSLLTTWNAESVQARRTVSAELVKLLDQAIAVKRFDLTGHHVVRLLALARTLDDLELERRATLIALKRFPLPKTESKEIASVLSAPKHFHEELARKSPVPDEAVQRAAMIVIANVYKPDYEKAKTSVQKIGLAKKLLGDGVDTKDDLISRFVMFRVSRDIASQQGGLATAFEAIDRITGEFDSDKLQMQVDAATAAVSVIKTPVGHQVCAELLAPLIDEAVATDRYDHAKSLATLTLGCARESKDSDRIKQMIAKSKEIEQMAIEFHKVNEMILTLKAKPTDPLANGTVGRFLCFVKRDWRHGITMLALGSDEDLRATALLELEEEPDSLKLGDAWWEIADAQEGNAKSRAQVHASGWYRKALPGLRGLTKTKIERRLLQMFPASTALLNSETSPTSKHSWRQLFNGRSLADWRSSNFDGGGTVAVEQGAIVLNVGVELTGITYTRDVPKMNYALEVEAQRLDRSDMFSGINFPVGEAYVSLIQAGYGGRVFGLSNLNGLDASKNETTKIITFENERWYTFLIEVTESRIKVWADQKLEVDFFTTGKKLTATNKLATDPKTASSKPLGIFSWQTKGAIRSIRVRTLTDEEIAASSVIKR